MINIPYDQYDSETMVITGDYMHCYNGVFERGYTIEYKDKTKNTPPSPEYYQWLSELGIMNDRKC